MVITGFAKSLLTEAKAIQKEAQGLALGLPEAEGLPSRSEMVLPKSLVRNSRRYIENVVNQINGAYENGLYDACAVMIRRLVETLIVEVFEYHHLDSKIKDANDDYHHMSKLVTATLNEPTWTLSRNTKKALPNLKDLGDLSAHNRRYNAHRNDIDKIISNLRVVTQELLSIAHIK